MKIETVHTEPSMFKLDAAAAQAIIAEEDALATLRKYEIAEVLAVVPDIEQVETEEEAFNALMEAMYRLRPVGYL